MPGRTGRSKSVSESKSKSLAISHAAHDFQDAEELGWGFSGTVFRTTHRLTRHVLARKYLHRSKWEQRQLQRTDELDIYTRFDLNRCPFIVCCYGAVDGFSAEKTSLLFELMAGGSLCDLLRHNQQPAESIIWATARALLGACAFFEEVGLVHGDIKPGNVLLNLPRGVVKLADFSEASSVALQSRIALESSDSSFASPGTGSMPYMAPERLINPRLRTFSSDVWSVGVVLLEMALGRYPFAEDEPASLGSSLSAASLIQAGSRASSTDCTLVELWESIMNRPLPLPDPYLYSHKLVHLIYACLQRDPTLRPSATELLQQLDL